MLKNVNVCFNSFTLTLSMKIDTSNNKAKTRINITATN